MLFLLIAIGITHLSQTGETGKMGLWEGTYTGDYLSYGNGQTTATALSDLLGVDTSHGKMTRFLSSETFEEKTLWKKVKRAVRAFERDNARLIFDDTVIEKRTWMRMKSKTEEHKRLERRNGKAR
ncbi:hypothetical protein Holit_02244 [Hollandina sp. SP2]